MPKISIFPVETATFTINPTKTAIQTHIVQAEYLLEGNLDNVNVDTTAAMATSAIINHADGSKPITGDKFIDGTSAFTGYVLNPLLALFKGNIVPRVLQGGCSFMLSKNPTGFYTSQTVIASDSNKKFLENLVDRSKEFKEQRKVEKLIEQFDIQTATVKTIIINKPKNIVPIMFSEVKKFWDRTPNLEYGNHWKYVWNTTVSVNGGFTGSLDEEDKPKITISEPTITPDYIVFYVRLKSPNFAADDYLTVDVNVSILCEIKP